jgi:hypothetical protein
MKLILKSPSTESHPLPSVLRKYNKNEAHAANLCYRNEVDGDWLIAFYWSRKEGLEASTAFLLHKSTKRAELLRRERLSNIPIKI